MHIRIHVSLPLSAMCSTYNSDYSTQCVTVYEPYIGTSTSLTALLTRYFLAPFPAEPSARDHTHGTSSHVSPPQTEANDQQPNQVRAWTHVGMTYYIRRGYIKQHNEGYRRTTLVTYIANRHTWTFHHSIPYPLWHNIHRKRSCNVQCLPSIGYVMQQHEPPIHEL